MFYNTLLNSHVTCILLFQQCYTSIEVCTSNISGLMLTVPTMCSPLWCVLSHLCFHNMISHMLSWTFIVSLNTLTPGIIFLPVPVSQLLMGLITRSQLFLQGYKFMHESPCHPSYCSKASPTRYDWVSMKIFWIWCSIPWSKDTFKFKTQIHIKSK